MVVFLRYLLQNQITCTGERLEREQHIETEIEIKASRAVLHISINRNVIWFWTEVIISNRI